MDSLPVIPATLIVLRPSSRALKERDGFPPFAVKETNGSVSGISKALEHGRLNCDFIIDYHSLQQHPICIFSLTVYFTSVGRVSKNLVLAVELQP